VACQECEALGVLLQKHGAQVAVAKADLAVVGDGARDAECLQALADYAGSLRSLAASSLDCESSADCVSPLCIFKADRLDVLYHVIDINTCVIADLLGFLNGGNAIVIQNFIDLVNSSLIRFK
jgi:hypothetical protein